MKKPEWPGIATTVGIIFAGTIIWAISRDPSFQLKDWQPLMAALIALLGGFLAYRAAMIKNDFERQAAERKIRKRKLALFLKASEVYVRLETEAREIDESLAFRQSRGRRRVLRSVILKYMPPMS